jgi:hypothetical protein
MKNFLLAILIIVILLTATFSGALLASKFLEKPALSTLGGVRLCTPTSSTVSVGHQFSATVLAAGSRDWAIIEQPANATNTVSLSIGGTAVAGSGYLLTPTTTPELHLGFATEFPTSAAVTARTAAASSTVNVIECK